MPEVYSKWVGESEKAVREIFKKAKQSAPSIVFLDELDSIAPRRGSYEGSRVTETVVNQLLTSMDGLETMENVVVVGATNRPDILDPSLLRAGRFDRLILVGSPDAEARLEIYKIHTKNMALSKDVNLDELANLSEGYVGADIESVCREAAMNALGENINTKNVNRSHFIKSLETVRPSVTKQMIEYYQKIAEELSSGISKRRKESNGVEFM